MFINTYIPRTYSVFLDVLVSGLEFGLDYCTHYNVIRHYYNIWDQTKSDLAL